MWPASRPERSTSIANDARPRSLISPQRSDPGIRQRRLAARFPIPTAPDKSAHTLIVENELWDRALHIHVAHECQCAVIEDEPLMIDPRCHDSMIFVWLAIPQYDDFHCIR